MLSRYLRQECRRFFTLLAVLVFVPACVEAQSSMTLTGRVSETVTLSVSPNFTEHNVNMSVVNIGRSTVRVTLSGTGAESPAIHLPLLVRSNSGFRIAANLESETAELTKLSVINVRATGRLVSPQAVNEIGRAHV